MEGNFFSQVIDSPARGFSAGPDGCECRELTWDSKTGGSPGHSDHAVVEFTLLRNMGQAKSKIWTLNFRTIGPPGNCPLLQGSRTELADL